MRMIVTMTDRFALVGALVEGAAAAQNRKAAYVARDEMLRLVPVLSGALKSSIEITRRGVGDYEITAGDDEVDYAAAVEFGTYRTPAQPYFVPGLEAGRKVAHASPEKKL